ncbi:MAG: hypothetical protein H6729_05395 [Deltaproteobacteria bacterium]|nr:hypothetical protein [Deltaproteobacteria bacterium]
MDPHLKDECWGIASIGSWLRTGVALRARLTDSECAALFLIRLRNEAATECFGPDVQAFIDEVCAKLRAAEGQEPSANHGRLHELHDALSWLPSWPIKSLADEIQQEIRDIAQERTTEAQTTAAQAARSKAPPRTQTSNETHHSKTAVRQAAPETERADVKEIAPAAALARRASPAAAIGTVAGPRRARTPLAMAKLGEDLSYGGSAVLTLVDDEVTRNPDGRLAFALKSRHGTCDPNKPGERLADLVLLLQRFRSPKDRRHLNTALIEETFGDVGQRLVDTLVQLSQVPRPPEPNLLALGQMVHRLRLCLPKGEAKALVDELVRRPNLLPASNPVLDLLLPSIPDGHLKDQGLIAAQHLLPSVLNLIEACIAKGMKPEHIHVISTPYNCNPLVAAYLELLGVHVQRSASFGLNQRGGRTVRTREIRKFLLDVAHDPIPPSGYRVLDDGGLLITQLLGGGEVHPADEIEAELIRNVCDILRPKIRSATEQTTRGLTEIEELRANGKLSIPVFTVANQPGKRREGALIGTMLANSELRELLQAGWLDKNPRLLNVSAGTVGFEAAIRLLKFGLSTALFDINPAQCAKAREQGFDGVILSELPRDPNAYDGLLSSVGKPPFSRLWLRRMRGVFGIGSSMNVDLDATQNGPLSGAMNLGNPLNFTGNGFERPAPEKIGMTIALLFLGICSDDAELGAGTFDLDPKRHDDIVKSAESLGGLDPIPVEPPRDHHLPRPDALSAAPTHDEWMTYLCALPRPVTPRTNGVGFVPGLYFFKDEAGGVRCVDTAGDRGGVRGLSFIVPDLTEVPERSMNGGAPTADHPVLLFEQWNRAKATIRVASGAPGALRLSEPIVVDGPPVSHYALTWLSNQVDGGILGAVPTRFAHGLVFEQGNELLVLWPGRWDEPCRYAKPFGDHTLVEMDTSTRLICMDRRSGTVKLIGERRPDGNILPCPLHDVQECLRPGPYNDKLFVGTAASGCPAIAYLGTRSLGGNGPSDQWKIFELPAGATVHDVYWPGDIYRFRITYTEAGVSPEPGNLKEIEYAPLDEVLDRLAGDERASDLKRRFHR